MTKEQEHELRELVESNLKRAEQRWYAVADKLEEAASLLSAKKAIPTALPGLPYIEPTLPLVRTFVVMMVDMRGSTTHLRESAPPGSTVSGLQRLFYETAALLPTIARLVAMNDGGVTEYLGDGALAFFNVSGKPTSIELARCVDVGDDCLQVTTQIINPALMARHRLPPLTIGVGISIGKAIVTTAGNGADERPIAFGEAVFDVSRLCKGENKVVIDEALERAWPAGKAGTTRFRSVSIKGKLGYERYRVA